MKIAGTLAALIAALLTMTQSASAQDWPRRGERNRPPQQQQQQPSPQGQGYGGGGGGACVPSGFARLSRNCSTNTGGCQRMPESCNRGWCCP
jgi:choline dehydrogenase-like flavoprotein